MGKNKRQNRQRDVIPIEEYQKQREKELGYTRQQIFNFDDNILEDEKEKNKKNYKRRSEIIELKKQILKLQRQKNNYKSVITVLSLISIVLLFIASIFLYIHIKYEPKYIERKKIIQDENIVFLGDSITYMYNLEKYYSNYNVVNSGISGNTTSDILSDMENRVYKYNPSKVFLLIGTNDIERKISEDETIANIKKIVEKIRKHRPYAKIYVESIYPINDTDSNKIDHKMVGIRTNKIINKYNKNIKKYCDSNNISYINIYNNLIDNDNNLKLEYTRDGLHISDDGYKVITKTIKYYLNG